MASFFEHADYLSYLETLFDLANKYDVAIHAFVLMTNHVHILATPHTCSGVSRLMQQLGSQYVSRINRLYRRSGTLWEGRFKSSLIDSEAYCLNCYRYIELNPVRANMVGHPGDYQWSSHRETTGMASRFPLTPHDQWLALGQTYKERCTNYRDLFSHVIPQDELNQLRFAVQKGIPTGSDQFKIKIETALSIRLGNGQLGRPKKGL